MDTAKKKLPEIHNEPIWCQESVFCVMVLLSAVLCMGHVCGNSNKNMRNISALFLTYLRKIKSAAVKPALADVLALNNLYNWSWCGGRCWYSWVFWHVWHFMYGVLLCLSFPPPQECPFSPWNAAFGVYIWGLWICLVDEWLVGIYTNNDLMS